MVLVVRITVHQLSSMLTSIVTPSLWLLKDLLINLTMGLVDLVLRI